MESFCEREERSAEQKKKKTVTKGGRSVEKKS